MKKIRSTEQMISKLLIIVILAVMLVVMMPNSVSAASSVTVEMQTNADSGAHPDAIYNFSINFKHQVASVNVALVFNDGNNVTSVRPDTVKVTLMRNSTAVESKDVAVKPNSSSNFNVLFGNLPASDDNGNNYNYTVSCTSSAAYGDLQYTSTPEGYTVNYNIKKFTFTVYHKDSATDEVIPGTTVIVPDIMYGANYTAVRITHASYNKPLDSVDTVEFSNITADTGYIFYYEPVNPSGASIGGNSNGASALLGLIPGSAAKTDVSITEKKTAGNGKAPSASATTQQNYNLPDNAYNATKASNGSFTKTGDGTYSFSLRLGEALVIPSLPNNVSYTVSFTGATLNGSSYSIKSANFTVDGSVGQQTSGTAAGKPKTVFRYSPPLLTLTLQHKDIETELPVSPTEYINFDSRGNLNIKAKTTIKDYKPVGVANRSYNGTTENRDYTFYYQSTDVEAGLQKISGQVFWEDNDITMRPKTVEIKLLCDDEVIQVKTIAVNEENSQPFSFGDFPIENEDKKAHIYTVSQVPSAIDGYKEPTYEGGAEAGFIIVNIIGTSTATTTTLFSDSPVKNGNTFGNNSSLFNISAAIAGFIAMLIIGVFGIVGQIKSKRHPDQKKPRKSAVQRIISMFLGLLLFVLALTLENISLPPAVFNANSVFFVPFLFLMLISVIMLAFSNKTAKRFANNKPLIEKYVPQPANDVRYKDESTQIFSNGKHIPLDKPKQQHKPMTLDDMSQLMASIVSEPLESGAESSPHIYKAESNEPPKKSELVNETNSNFAEFAIKNPLIDDDVSLTNLHVTKEITALKEETVHQTVAEQQPPLKSFDEHEHEKQVSAQHNANSYEENRAQIVIDDGWFGD